MAKKEFTCTRCDEKFTPGNWNCNDGQRHSVELKTYYTSTEGLTLHYGPVHGEDVMSHSRGVLTFVRGTYQTTDPEQQETLDTYPGCISFERWKETHIDEKERAAMAAREKVRLEKTNNDLLETVRKQAEELEALRKQNAKKGN
jgi:hypothetical protein